MAKVGENRIDRVVILAGGSGARLWPWTGPTLPKPLLPLGGGGRSLLRAVIDRATAFIDPRQIDIQTPLRLVESLRKVDGGLGDLKCTLEPSARDTGPAIALAVRRLWQVDREAIVVFLPADQRIEDEAAFAAAVDRAAGLAAEERLVCLGIRPDTAETGYGYIEVGEAIAGGSPQANSVRRFCEKPDLQTAERWLAAGTHYWNAGIFAFHVGYFWSLLEEFAPELAAAVARYLATDDSAAWEAGPRISIDYALLEKCPSLAVVGFEGGWSDVGQWRAIRRLIEAGDAGGILSLPVTPEPQPSPVDPPLTILQIASDSVQERVGEARALHLGPPGLVVSGPHGVLVTPWAEVDRVKSLV